MKKTCVFLLSLLLAFPVAGRAQADDIPRNEIMLGMGFSTSNMPWSLGNEYDYDIMYASDSPLKTYRKLKVYEDGSEQSPCFSVGYRRDVEWGRWFAYGLTVSYEREKCDWKERLTGRTKVTDIESYFTVMPTLRFYYLRHRGFRMYAEAGIGASLGHEKFHYSNYSRDQIKLTGQLTAFGIQVGKRVFFSTELGYGCLGVVRMGLGCRF